MQRAETGLEIFKQAIFQKMIVNLRCNNFSQIFERKCKLVIGRKLAKLLGSAPGFLSLGVITATLKDEGTTPEVRDECIISVTISDREDKQALTR